jgi:uncharacterized protein
VARIVLLIVIVAILYLLFRGFFRAQVKKDAPPPATTSAGEDMIKCARCGVNLPRSEAHTVDGKLVCQNNPQCR